MVWEKGEREPVVVLEGYESCVIDVGVDGGDAVDCAEKESPRVAVGEDHDDESGVVVGEDDDEWDGGGGESCLCDLWCGGGQKQKGGGLGIVGHGVVGCRGSAGHRVVGLAVVRFGVVGRGVVVVGLPVDFGLRGVVGGDIVGVVVDGFDWCRGGVVEGRGALCRCGCCRLAWWYWVRRCWT